MWFVLKSLSLLIFFLIDSSNLEYYTVSYQEHFYKPFNDKFILNLYRIFTYGLAERQPPAITSDRTLRNT